MGDDDQNATASSTPPVVAKTPLPYTGTLVLRSVWWDGRRRFRMTCPRCAITINGMLTDEQVSGRAPIRCTSSSCAFEETVRLAHSSEGEGGPR